MTVIAYSCKSPSRCYEFWGPNLRDEIAVSGTLSTFFWTHLERDNQMNFEERKELGESSCSLNEWWLYIQKARDKTVQLILRPSPP